MVFREACICLGRMTVSVFEELERALRAPGYSLDHPESHAVQIVRTEADVTSDDEFESIGEQLPLSRAELLKRIDQRRPTMVVFWGPDWYTLDCTIYFGTTADLLSCELGAMVGEPLETPTTAALEGFFWHQAETGNGVGLMLDPDGLTEEYDWRDFFLAGGRFDGPLPRMLVVAEPLVAQIDDELLASSRVERRAGFVVIRAT